MVSANNVPDPNTTSHERSIMLVTQNQFDFLKKRYNEYRDEGFPGIDPLMVNIVTQLNEFDDITTVWCCEGHHGQQRPWFDEHLLTMDVNMVVRSVSGLSTLYSVIETINYRLSSPFGMRLVVSQLLWGWSGYVGYYPVVSIEKDYRIHSKEQEESVKISWVTILSDAIEYVKNNNRTNVASIPDLAGPRDHQAAHEPSRCG